MACPGAMAPARPGAMSSPSPQRRMRHAALALGLGAGAALAGALGGASALDDLVQRGLRPAPRPAPVLVLGIDATDPWPWSNDRLAVLLQRLHAAGVRGIGLDLPLDDEPARDAKADASDDATLARALLEDAVVLGIALEPQPGAAPRARLPAVEFTDAARLGHLLLPRDRDGRIRRHLPQVRADDGMPWPSLALALRDAATGTATERRADAAPWFVDAGFAPPTRRAADLLDGRLEPSRLRGQWVLVGLVDPARQVRQPGPHGTAPLFPVQHQARALATLLQGVPPRPLPALLQALLALLITAAAAYAGWPRNGAGRRTPLALLAGIATALALSIWSPLPGYRFLAGATIGTLLVMLFAWTMIVPLARWRMQRRLPGLATRRQLQAAVQAAAGAGAAHALLLLDGSLHGDRDHDTIGAACKLHMADLLRALARRPDDLAAWLGGCRFALLLHGTSAAAAAGILERVREQAAEQGLSLQGQVLGCGPQGCDCLRHLGAQATPAR